MSQSQVDMCRIEEQLRINDGEVLGAAKLEFLAQCLHLNQRGWEIASVLEGIEGCATVKQNLKDCLKEFIIVAEYMKVCKYELQ